MAHIRTYETAERRKVSRYVSTGWSGESLSATSSGLPTKNTCSAGERPQTRAAEARRDELNAARHTTGTSALREQRKAGEQPFGYYTRAWLDAQRVKVASGAVKAATVDGYAARLAVYVLPEFGAKAIAAITPRDCEQFLAALVGRGLTPATLKHHWSVLRNVFVYALRHKAITANPVHGVDFSANSAERRNRRHHPLTAEQVAAVANSIGERYPVYELMTYFAAYTGLRAEELGGVRGR